MNTWQLEAQNLYQISFILHLFLAESSSAAVVISLALSLCPVVFLIDVIWLVFGRILLINLPFSMRVFKSGSIQRSRKDAIDGNPWPNASQTLWQGICLIWRTTRGQQQKDNWTCGHVCSGDTLTFNRFTCHSIWRETTSTKFISKPWPDLGELQNDRRDF